LVGRWASILQTAVFLPVVKHPRAAVIALAAVILVPIPVPAVVIAAVIAAIVVAITAAAAAIAVMVIVVLTATITAGQDLSAIAILVIPTIAIFVRAPVEICGDGGRCGYQPGKQESDRGKREWSEGKQFHVCRENVERKRDGKERVRLRKKKTVEQVNENEREGKAELAAI